MKNKSVLFCCIVFGLAVLFAAGCRLVPSLGRNPEGEALSFAEQQFNYKAGKFHNLPYPQDTVQAHKRISLWRVFKAKADSVVPPWQLPWMKTNLKQLPDSLPVVTWFGHSSVLIKHRGLSILIDPIFSNNAGPVPGFMKAFKGANHYKVKHLPRVDVIIISHDHYDHLDYRTMQKLRNQVKKVVVPVGVGSHLKYWGFKPEQIVELNWHQYFAVTDKVKITATPARHRSNRTLEGNKTLWASYVISLGNYQLFYSGDGGYGHHFKSIGKRYGPFHLALLECGQYNADWPHSHMFPAQTAQAAADLDARVLQPVHWAKFAESEHIWNEPVRQLLPAAKLLHLQVNVPLIGEPFVISGETSAVPWWEM